MAAAAIPQVTRDALVLGASRGLGLGLARELARRGWRVTGTVRDARGAAALAAAGGGVAVEEGVDVARPGDVEALAGRLAGRRLGLLFVNAGIAGPRDHGVDRATDAEVAELFVTNAVGPVRAARRLLPLIADGGTIAFMSSQLGSVANNTSGGMDLYRASKAALNTLTRGFAANDVGRRPVAVLSLHPGWVRTDMGGPNAAVGVEESVRGLAEVIEARRGPGHWFLDYRGQPLPW